MSKAAYDISNLEWWATGGKCPTQVSKWAKLLQHFGPAFLPFLIDERYVKHIPEDDRSLKKFKKDVLKCPSRTFKTYPGAAWVLMAHLDKYAELPEPFFKPGFLFPLEWKKAEEGSAGQHSALLPRTLLELADKIKLQFAENGIVADDFYLHPWHGFRDTVDFSKMDASFDSAWGALATGLCSVITSPTDGMLANWPFSSIAFDFGQTVPMSVSDLPKKLHIVACFGGRELAVAPNQQAELRLGLKGELSKIEGEWKRYALPEVAKIKAYDWKWKAADFHGCLYALARCNQCRISRRTIRICVRAFFLTVLVGCIAWWDMAREVVLYYESFCDVWGEPQGIQQVSPRDVRDRCQTYRFSYRGYVFPHGFPQRQLRRITCINSSGYAVEQRMEDVFGIIDGHSDAVDWHYEHDGGHTRIIGQKRDGTRVFSLEFDATNPDCAILNMSQSRNGFVNPHGREHYIEDVRPCPIHILRDVRGYVLSVRYLNDIHANRCAFGLLGYGSGVNQILFGMRDAEGRVVSAKTLDDVGNPYRDRWGNTECEYQYEDGVISEIVAKGDAVTNHVRCTEIDADARMPRRVIVSKGNVTNSLWFWEWKSGKLITDRRVVASGCTNMMHHVSYDECGSRKCTKVFYNGNLTSVIHNDRVYENGKMLSYSRYVENASGEKIPQTDGACLTETLFDKDGRWTIESRFDKEGRLCDNYVFGANCGKVRIKQMHSETFGGAGHGETVSEVKVLDENCAPTIGRDGWHTLRSGVSYNANGSLVSVIETRGLTNELVNWKSGCWADAAIINVNMLGKKLHLSFRGIYDEPVLSGGDEYDCRYHCMDTVYENVNSWRYCLYDCATNPIPMMGVDMQNRPIRAIGAERRNDWEITTLWSSLVGGTKMDGSIGWAEQRRKKTPLGVVEKIEEYDSYGKLLRVKHLDETGVCRVEFFDAAGRIAKCLMRGSAGELKEEKEGYVEALRGRTSANPAERIKWLRFASDEVSRRWWNCSPDLLRDSCKYACLLLKGEYVVKDVKLAMQKLQECAARGDSLARYELGSVYFTEYKSRRYSSGKCLDELRGLKDFELLKLAEGELGRSNEIDARTELVVVRDELGKVRDQWKANVPKDCRIGARKTIMLPGNVPMVFCWCPATTSREWWKLTGGCDWFGYYVHTNRFEVSLTSGFWIAQTEVTQRQYESVMRESGTYNAESVRAEDLSQDLPVYWGLTWSNCVEFCERVSAKLDKGQLMTLPTEAQWVYACRAGTNAFSRLQIENMAWHDGNSSNAVHAVKMKEPNVWGIHDMLGNVSEYCIDRLWIRKWPSGITCVVDPIGDIKLDPCDMRRNSDDTVSTRGGWFGATPLKCTDEWKMDVQICGDDNYFCGFRPIIWCP